MTKEIKMHTVICDNCGKDAFEESEYAGFNDQSFALDCAKEEGYVEHEHNHYCIDCYEYDDNDEFVIKKINPVKP